MVRTLMVAAVLAIVPAGAWAQADKPAPTLKREAAKPTSSSDGGADVRELLRRLSRQARAG